MFEGEIVVVQDDEGIKLAFKEISRHKEVGFDTETKPVFIRGHHNKVAILQIALPKKVFVFNPILTKICLGTAVKLSICNSVVANKT